MQVKTGKGPISFMVVLAIWSLSLAVDLPGLAITPILNDMNHIFGNVSQLEVEWLTVAPNLLIIPFVLLSGKLSLSNHKRAIVVSSLIIYLAAGILYLFAHSMIELILIGCLLGVGCGLLIPFSTGLIADVFVGKYRMQQMGIISAIGNLAVVAATFLVGYIVEINWHFPFLVYLIPIVPLLLSPWLKKIPSNDLADPNNASTTGGNPKADTSVNGAQNAAQPAAQTAPAVQPLYPARPGEKVVGGFYLGRSVWLYLAYFFFVYATTCPSLYMSYLLGDSSAANEATSTITSLFYLAMVVMGFALTPILRTFRKASFLVAFLTVIFGFAVMSFTKNTIWLGVAYCVMGLGNGMAQPIFYDKATENVVSDSHSTLSLAFLLAANYLAISAAPEIVSFFKWVFHTDSNVFPFILNLVASVAVFIVMLIRFNGFVFGIKKEYYE